MAPVAAVLGQGAEHVLEHPGTDPALVATVTRLVGRIALGQVVPGRTGLEDPENAIEYVAGIAPGSPPTLGAAARARQQGLQNGPLFLCEVHRSSTCVTAGLKDSTRPSRLFMR